MADGDDRCGFPTKAGHPCKNTAMAGTGGRCHVHAGLEPTPAEQAASRTNPIEHGYFVSGFLDDDERDLFREVLDGTTDPGEIRRQLIAALVVRAARMTRWEAEGQQISGFTTEVFGELRQALDSLDPDELSLQVSWDDAQVAAQVEQTLGRDPDLVVRLLPPEVRDTVRQALDEGG